MQRQLTVKILIRKFESKENQRLISQILLINTKNAGWIYFVYLNQYSEINMADSIEE